MLNDTEREGGYVASTELVIDKGGKKDGKGSKRTYHSATVLGILGTSPREGEKEASQRG